ncbi:MAG TPA: hypothetical protein PK037_10890 [Saprospiraceae bacterium]|nr:hypothetical protein [Saprospiraceae bacterium]
MAEPVEILPFSGKWGLRLIFIPLLTIQDTMQKIILTHLFAFCLLPLFSQITVVNPGFEDQAADATVPKGWLPCEDNTTPDILPGFWGEYGDASQGNTYVGLITRENATFESIGQRLSKPLSKGECYRFKIDLARGAVYAGFNKAIKLRIWVAENKCEKGQLIYTSDFIQHTDWKTYMIEFTSNKNHKYIRFEAYYKDGNFSHKGNVLLDNLSAIQMCGRA